MSDKEEWEAPEELPDDEDWPYDEEVDDELVREILSDWDDIEEVDDFKYVEGER